MRLLHLHENGWIVPCRKGNDREKRQGVWSISVQKCHIIICPIVAQHVMFKFTLSYDRHGEQYINLPTSLCWTASLRGCDRVTRISSETWMSYRYNHATIAKSSILTKDILSQGNEIDNGEMDMSTHMLAISWGLNSKSAYRTCPLNHRSQTRTNVSATAWSLAISNSMSVSCWTSSSVSSLTSVCTCSVTYQSCPPLYAGTKSSRFSIPDPWLWADYETDPIFLTRFHNH